MVRINNPLLATLMLLLTNCAQSATPLTEGTQSDSSSAVTSSAQGSATHEQTTDQGAKDSQGEGTTSVNTSTAAATSDQTAVTRETSMATTQPTITLDVDAGDSSTSVTSLDSSIAVDGGSSSIDVETSAGVPASCTPSVAANVMTTGTGPHDVIVETNNDPGISEGTIFRPADLGGNQKYPILVWGQGGCSQNGLANTAAMAEIASHGYFVVADGTPGGTGGREMDRGQLAAMGAPLLAYVDWVIAENAKSCSAYYDSVDVTKVAANGFSCGGLMAQGTVTDPRIVTWGVTSSGMAGADTAFYQSIHTPVLFVEGGPEEVAYYGALEGFENVRELGVPTLWFSKDLGHGGDLLQAFGGDFTKINLAWLNWWLKGDETSTGKGLLVGDACPYCADPAWEVMAANVE